MPGQSCRKLAPTRGLECDSEVIARTPNRKDTTHRSHLRQNSRHQKSKTNHAHLGEDTQIHIMRRAGISAAIPMKEYVCVTSEFLVCHGEVGQSYTNDRRVFDNLQSR